MEETLTQLLKATRDRLSEGLSEERCRNFKTEEIKRKINLFNKKEVEPLVTRIEQVEKIVQSPYHVGFLGRYSHGKTALVNSLFCLDDNMRLPEGEGVVTSKVTYASFERNSFSVRAYQVPHGDSEPKPVDLETLRGLVGKSDVDTSAINYFKLYLPVEGKSFSEMFADKNINLVDMPGLGGPYFRDMDETKRYLDQMDVLVVVIRMDEIEESGRVLNPIVGAYSNPITVLTFDDVFTKSKLYYDCDEDIDKAIGKARKLIEEHIPNLHVTNIIPVSSTTKHNIDALRTMIIGTIDSHELAIQKARKDISPVYKRRLMEFQREYSVLKSDLQSLSKGIDTLLNAVLPENNNKDIDIFSGTKGVTRVIRAERELNNEINKGVNECYSHYRELVDSLRNCSENDYKNRIEKVCKSSNSSVIRNLQERISSAYRSYCDILSSELRRTIDGLTFDTKTRDNLISEIQDKCEQSNIDFSDLQIINDSSIQTKHFVTYGKLLTVSFLEGLSHDPTCLIMIAIGILLSSISILGWHFLFKIGIILIICGVVSVLIKQPNQRKKAFRDAMDQTINDLDSLFDANYFKETVQRMKETAQSDLDMDIKDIARKDILEYNQDAKSLKYLKDDIDESISKLSAKLEEEMCSFSMK